MSEYLALTKLSNAELSKLETYERIIKDNLEAFYDTGIALMQIRDGKLYRADYMTFEEYCRKRWGFVASRARQLIGAAEVIQDLQGVTIVTPINEAQTRPLSPLEPGERLEVWTQAVETAPNGNVTAAHVQRTAENFKGLKSHQLIHSSESNEWYTPAIYIDAVRKLLGVIDLDPATCEEANITVRAKRIFTIEDDGLSRDWTDKVFLNPPYGIEDGDSNQARWSAKLIDEYTKGNVSEAVLLVNAVTDRKWFQPLWAYPICFTDHRISFYSRSGKPSQPTHGNAFVYFGKRIEMFVKLFKQFGPVVRRV